MSAKKRGSGKGNDGGAGDVPPPPTFKAKKGRSSDLGRALRTVYDDTLRESVPDDFLDLIGKLS